MSLPRVLFPHPLSPTKAKVSSSFNARDIDIDMHACMHAYIINCAYWLLLSENLQDAAGLLKSNVVKELFKHTLDMCSRKDATEKTGFANTVISKMHACILSLQVRCD